MSINEVYGSTMNFLWFICVLYKVDPAFGTRNISKDDKKKIALPKAIIIQRRLFSGIEKTEMSN